MFRSVSDIDPHFTSRLLSLKLKFASNQFPVPSSDPSVQLLTRFLLESYSLNSTSGFEYEEDTIRMVSPFSSSISENSSEFWPPPSLFFCMYDEYIDPWYPVCVTSSPRVFVPGSASI